MYYLEFVKFSTTTLADNSIQSFNIHKDTQAILQYQKANCQKTRVKAEFRHNKQSPRLLLASKSCYSKIII